MQTVKTEIIKRVTYAAESGTEAVIEQKLDLHDGDDLALVMDMFIEEIYRTGNLRAERIKERFIKLTAKTIAAFMKRHENDRKGKGKRKNGQNTAVH